MTEKEAKAIILKWCREEMGRAMRGGVQGQPACRVVNVNHTEPDPDGRPWERRSIIYAEGETWAECLEGLKLAEYRDRGGDYR